MRTWRNTYTMRTWHGTYTMRTSPVLWLSHPYSAHTCRNGWHTAASVNAVSLPRLERIWDKTRFLATQKRVVITVICTCCCNYDHIAMTARVTRLVCWLKLLCPSNRTLLLHRQLDFVACLPRGGDADDVSTKWELTRA